MTKGRDRNKKQLIKEQGEQSGHSDSDSQTGMCPRAYGDLINIPSPALETLRLEARSRVSPLWVVLRPHLENSCLPSWWGRLERGILMDGVRLHAQVKSLDRALICEMVKK